MNSREALNNIQYMLEQTNNLVFYKEEIEAIEKDLEVLEIIKTKKPYFSRLVCSKTVEQYNKVYTAYEPFNSQLLTEEEFKLLKEWL